MGPTAFQASTGTRHGCLLLPLLLYRPLETEHNAERREAEIGGLVGGGGGASALPRAPERQRKRLQNDERVQESRQTQNTYFTSISLTILQPRPREDKVG